MDAAICSLADYLGEGAAVDSDGGRYNAHKVTRLQLRRVGGSATIEEVNRDDTDDGLAPRLRSH